MKKEKESLYFLAIIPDGEIREEVLLLKQLALEKFGTKAALRSPAHITLHMPFKWRTDREQILIDTLNRFNFPEFPVSIEADGFGFFEPRVIFIKILENDLIRKLQKELSTYVRRELNIFNADYKDKPFHPHMTIAFRDLKKSIFPEAESFFMGKKYQANFQINEICLLKHSGKIWEEFRYF